jgi:hypothetical protein
MKTEKSVIVLKSLLNGVPVRKGTSTYILSEDFKLCLEAEDTKGNTKLLVVNLGIELSDFILWANSFTDEEMFLVVANYSLNILNKKKR